VLVARLREQVTSLQQKLFAADNIRRKLHNELQVPLPLPSPPSPFPFPSRASPLPSLPLSLLSFPLSHSLPLLPYLCYKVVQLSLSLLYQCILL
jgi:hypothetical protein